jgi:hypothetical protein
MSDDAAVQLDLSLIDFVCCKHEILAALGRENRRRNA